MLFIFAVWNSCCIFHQGCGCQTIGLSFFIWHIGSFCFCRTLHVPFCCWLIGAADNFYLPLTRHIRVWFLIKCVCVWRWACCHLFFIVFFSPCVETNRSRGACNLIFFALLPHSCSPLSVLLHISLWHTRTPTYTLTTTCEAHQGPIFPHSPPSISQPPLAWSHSADCFAGTRGLWPVSGTQIGMARGGEIQLVRLRAHHLKEGVCVCVCVIATECR